MDIALVPPHDSDAEESILSAMLLSSTAIDVARELISEADFYRASNGIIFTAALRLHDSGEPVDPITMRDELERVGLNNPERVHELAALMAVSGNVKRYATIVREHALFRGITALGADIAELGYARETSSLEALAKTEDLVAILTKRGGVRADKRIRLFDALEDFQERMQNPPAVLDGVPTPFSFLAPLRASRLYVLGAYQADGKTVTAAQFVRSAAEARKRVGFVSIEMGWRDLTDRFISSMGVPYHRVQSGDLGQWQPAVDAAVRTMAGWDVDIIDDSDVNVASLRAYQRSYDYELLIIDHFHRLDWSDRRDLERSLRAITNIARDFEIPVLMLAQLSRSKREGLKSAFPRPNMASIRESGMIEAEAAAVWFVWRHRDDNDLPMDQTEFIIAKNRFGETGVRDLHFNRSQVHFTESQ